MTEEAMNVAAEAAPMPEAQVSSAPAETSQPSAPAEPTPRGAIERAFAAMQEKNRTAEQSAQPETQQTGRERNPDGTFKATDAAQQQPKDAQQQVAKPEDAAKPATTFAEAPSRFSPDAKAAWATAPEPVKAEVTRAIKELEGGIQQYQQAFEPYKDFDKQLKATGQTFKEVFDHYTGIENLLAQDPIKGLDTICRNLGLSIEQVAAHVLGQPQDQQRTQTDTYINELKSEIADLKKQIGGVTTTIQSQQEKALLDQIDAFAADPAHGRFDELSETITKLLTNGMAPNLEEAYTMADRLNPAPVVAPPVPAAPAAQQQTASPQTRKGQLSPSGAPASGSNPASRKPPESPRDALQRAFASVGI